MGKKITIYLTEKEMEMMQKICDHNGNPSMSRALKNSLLEMFQNCHFVPEHDHKGIVGSPLMKTAVIETDQHWIEELPSDKLANEGLKKRECPDCGHWYVYPDSQTLLKLSDDKLKEKGLKRYRCSKCGKDHLTDLNNIVIQESPMEKEKRLKLEKARAEAEKFIKSATDPIDKMMREGFAGQRLKKALREVDE